MRSTYTLTCGLLSLAGAWLSAVLSGTLALGGTVPPTPQQPHSSVLRNTASTAVAPASSGCTLHSLVLSNIIAHVEI